MNRSLLIGIIVFVGAAFLIAALSGGQGWIFLASVGVAATLLIAAVLILASSGEASGHSDSPDIDFSAFERASSLLLGGMGNGTTGPETGSSDDATRGREYTKVSARVFVATLVPAPRPPTQPEDAAARREVLEALRREGTGLIRLAKVVGVDVSPYQAFLAEIRGEANRGDWQGTLRSLRLANELLRATIEKHLVNRREGGEDLGVVDET